MTTDRPQHTFLTVAEVAERLKLCEQTVRNMIDRGELAAIRVGPRRIRVREAELDRFLAAGATAPVSKPGSGRNGRKPPTGSRLAGGHSGGFGKRCSRSLPAGRAGSCAGGRDRTHGGSRLAAAGTGGQAESLG